MGILGLTVLTALGRSWRGGCGSSPSVAWGIASDQRLDTSKLLCAKPSGQTGQLSGLVASEKPIAKSKNWRTILWKKWRDQEIWIDMNGCVQVLHLRLMFVPLPTSLGQRVIAGDSRSWFVLQFHSSKTFPRLHEFEGWSPVFFRTASIALCTLDLRVMTTYGYAILRHTTSIHFTVTHEVRSLPSLDCWHQEFKNLWSVTSPSCAGHQAHWVCFWKGSTTQIAFTCD